MNFSLLTINSAVQVLSHYYGRFRLTHTHTHTHSYSSSFEASGKISYPTLIPQFTFSWFLIIIVLLNNYNIIVYACKLGINSFVI